MVRKTVLRYKRIQGTMKERRGLKFMNEALKLKWHSLYGQILQDRKIAEAWKQVKANHGSGGIDGVSIEEFTKHEEENLEELLNELKRKEYKPTPVRRVYIPKKNGKKRPLGIPIIKDRIVQQVLYNILSPKYENGIFHNWSVGYRPRRGADSAMQVIIKNIEEGRNWIYDCDIKGFFDNIPHKKLMKVLNKCIADGTVLDLIWSWLKAGYMEEGKHLPTISGTPQGGVISPLLANIYLNELDWKLHEAKIHFVRYADDFLLFAESEQEIERAGTVAREVISSMGLEMEMNKTKIVNFEDDDFTFLGFDFRHWRTSKKGNRYYYIEPAEKSLKEFKKKIKDKTQRKLTLSKEEWIKQVNTVIVGKVNYYLNVYKAIEVLKRHDIEIHCLLQPMGTRLHAIDQYTRQRLRMCMIHKHPTIRKAFGMTHKWNIEWFSKVGLKPANWYYYHIMNGYTLEQYVEKQQGRNKLRGKNNIEKQRQKGIEIFSKERQKKMAYAMSK